MILYTKPTVIITYDDDKTLFYLKWIGFTPGKEFREIIDITFEFMLKENIYRILSDIKEQKVVAPQEQDYFKDAALRFYRKTGKLKIAFITDQKSLAFTCAQRYNRAVLSEIGLDINRFFDCEEDALSWLMEV